MSVGKMLLLVRLVLFFDSLSESLFRTTMTMVKGYWQAQGWPSLIFVTRCLKSFVMVFHGGDHRSSLPLPPSY